MSKSGKAVMFDLGGVLVENTGRDGLMALLPYVLSNDEIWSRWLNSPAVRAFEMGRTSSETFASDFIEEWQLEIDPPAFIAAFASWPKGFFPGATDLVRDLREHHTLACLSNTNAIHWARFPDFSTLFDASFASHLMGMVKPDRAAFEYTIHKLALHASDIYFFDDLLPNVEAARAAGLNAFHVAEFEAIRPVLRAQKLI